MDYNVFETYENVVVLITFILTKKVIVNFLNNNLRLLKMRF